MDRPEPYVGITGFTKREEVESVLLTVPENMVAAFGILMSDKTLYSKPSNPCRYPPRESIASIPKKHPNVVYYIHFNTSQPEHLLRDMLRTQQVAGPGYAGFQLNMAWPSKGALHAYRRCAALPSSPRIILQCGGRAIKAVGGSAEAVVERVREYEGLVDYVLIDPSGGTGRLFDVDFARGCFERLQDSSIMCGVAGGLKAETLFTLLPLRREFRNSFCIDAESGLRDENDDLSIECAKRFLAETYIQMTVFAEDGVA